MTPRQAYAISVQLDVWNDIEISEWVLSPDEPLHTMGPFEALDLCVMMMVGENRAWAAGVARRCAARAWAEVDPTLVEPVPARDETGADASDCVDRVEDDYWDELYGEFDDRARWTDYLYPLLIGNPALRLLLDERPPPLTWLDPQFDRDPELSPSLERMFGVGE